MAKALLEQGDKLLSKGNLPQALKKYAESINTEPSITAFRKRASIYSKIEKYSEAEEDIKQAIEQLKSVKDATERDRQFQELISMRYKLKEQQGKVKEALADLQRLSLSSHYQSEITRLGKLLQPDQTELEQEKKQFLELYRENMAVQPNSQWHVVSAKWFQKWQLYVGFCSPEGNEDLPFNFEFIRGRAEYPGVIDNTDIIELKQTEMIDPSISNNSFNICLKNGISENTDYVLLPEEAFMYLFEKYKCLNDIKRFAIEFNDTMYQVEVFLKSVSFCYATEKDLKFELVNVSRKEKVSKIKIDVTMAKSIKKPTRVWKVSNSLSAENLRRLVLSREEKYLTGAQVLSEDLTVDDAELGEEDIILIEQTVNGLFLLKDKPVKPETQCLNCNSAQVTVKCPNCSKALYCSEKCMEAHKKKHKASCKRPIRRLLRCFCKQYSKTDSDEEEPAPALQKKQTAKSRMGITGLQNLGNTCFMNSALQCLSHTEVITEYFLSGSYLKDINKSNPLGTKGKLASAYAEILENLWRGTSSSFAPWKLKKTLAMFAPQFVGYQQHDSHELLCYLLDGLHEDLNTIIKKPYFEELVTNGKTEIQIATESWYRHLQRNRSLFQKLMHGQYKSTIYCPYCKNYSYVFDPFNTLTLPIAENSEKKLGVYFIFENASELPRKVYASVSNSSTGEDLRRQVAKIMNIKQEEVLLVSVLNDTFRNVIEDKANLQSFSKSTIFAFEISPITRNTLLFEVTVSHERKKSGKFAFPRLVQVSRSSSLEDLHLEVFKKFHVYVKDYSKLKPKHSLYKNHLENPTYKVYLEGRTQKCSVCKELNCPGCQLPYSQDSVLALFDKQLTTLDLRLKVNCERLGVNTQEMNRCTEYPGHYYRDTPRSKAPIDIKKCFEMFRTPEELEKDNAWYCPTCKTHVQAIKKFEIYKVPPILVVHLKRFRSRGYHREKLNIPVNFPERELDISEFVIGPEPVPKYDLYAVSNHYGSLGGGHYTATCFNSYQERWVEFSDSNASTAREISPTASYLLFYKANNIQELLEA